MTSIALPDLHDATLTDVHFYWAQGVCVVSFAGSPNGPTGPFSLAWANVTDLQLPRRMEWGPSVSVSNLTEVGPDHWVLEMQSGDELVLRGKLSADGHLDV